MGNFFFHLLLVLFTVDIIEISTDREKFVLTQFWKYFFSYFSQVCFRISFHPRLQKSNEWKEKKKKPLTIFIFKINTYTLSTVFFLYELCEGSGLPKMACQLVSLLWLEKERKKNITEQTWIKYLFYQTIPTG